MRLVLIASIYATVVYGTVIVRNDLSGKARVTFVADFALAGLAFMLLGELRRGGDDLIKWIVGARAERLVGQALSFFEHQGCLVVHGYPKNWGGDIDHIVCGRNGGYIIETKSYEFRARDLRQTLTNAWWLREKLQVQWVTGVLCVPGNHEPERKGKAWVVGRERLVEWLDAQRNAPVDPKRARELLFEERSNEAVAAVATGLVSR
jgi:hypothetical protein